MKNRSHASGDKKKIRSIAIPFDTSKHEDLKLKKFLGISLMAVIFFLLWQMWFSLTF